MVLFKLNVTLLAYQAGQKVKLIQQEVPMGFVELQEQFVSQRIANSDSHKDGAHMLTWNELK